MSFDRYWHLLVLQVTGKQVTFNSILLIVWWLFSFSVAASVLKHSHLELDGYRLELKEQQPELNLPIDRKKLYVENIEPTTTKDSLSNYIEVMTRMDVLILQFGTGDSKNALATFQKEPGNVIR